MKGSILVQISPLVIAGLHKGVRKPRKAGQLWRDPALSTDQWLATEMDALRGRERNMERASPLTLPYPPWGHTIFINDQEGEAQCIFKYLSSPYGRKVPAALLRGWWGHYLHRAPWAAITPKGPLHHQNYGTAQPHHHTSQNRCEAALGLNFQRPDSCTVRSRAAEIMMRAQGASP